VVDVPVADSDLEESSGSEERSLQGIGHFILFGWIVATLAAAGLVAAMWFWGEAAR